MFQKTGEKVQISEQISSFSSTTVVDFEYSFIYCKSPWSAVILEGSLVSFFMGFLNFAQNPCKEPVDGLIFTLSI